MRGQNLYRIHETRGEICRKRTWNAKRTWWGWNFYDTALSPTCYYHNRFSLLLIVTKLDYHYYSQSGILPLKLLVLMQAKFDIATAESSSKMALSLEALHLQHKLAASQCQKDANLLIAASDAKHLLASQEQLDASKMTLQNQQKQHQLETSFASSLSSIQLAFKVWNSLLVQITLLSVDFKQDRLLNNSDL